jgi:hypothetical protein
VWRAPESSISRYRTCISPAVEVGWGLCSGIGPDSEKTTGSSRVAYFFERKHLPLMFKRQEPEEVLPPFVFCRDCKAVVLWFYNDEDLCCKPAHHVIATFHVNKN